MLKTVDALPRLCDMSMEETSSWLSMFLVEIRRQGGKPYPGSTLKHILTWAVKVYAMHKLLQGSIVLSFAPCFGLKNERLRSGKNRERIKSETSILGSQKQRPHKKYYQI